MPGVNTWKRGSVTQYPTSVGSCRTGHDFCQHMVVGLADTGYIEVARFELVTLLFAKHIPWGWLKGLLDGQAPSDCTLTYLSHEGNLPHKRIKDILRAEIDKGKVSLTSCTSPEQDSRSFIASQFSGQTNHRFSRLGRLCTPLIMRISRGVFDEWSAADRAKLSAGRDIIFWEPAGDKSPSSSILMQKPTISWKFFDISLDAYIDIV